MAAVDYFLKIDGVEGESTSDKHKGEIDIESFSWGVANSASAAHGGRRRWQSRHAGLPFRDALQQSLTEDLPRRRHRRALQKAVLTARKAGKQQADYLTWTMSDCLVSSYQTGANTRSRTESVGGTEEPSPEVNAARNGTSGSAGR